MPRQYYSDKFIRQQHQADMAEDRLERSKAMAEQTLSEERESRRRMRHEAIEDAKRKRDERFSGPSWNERR